MPSEPGTREVDEAIERLIENEKRAQVQEERTVTKNKPKKSQKSDDNGDRSPVHTLIDRLGDKPGQYKTTKQVADELGVSESTIRRLAKKPGVEVPSYYTKMGELTVALYTKDDVKKVKKHLSDRHTLIPAEKLEN